MKRKHTFKTKPAFLGQTLKKENAYKFIIMKIRNIMENIGRHQPKKKYCNNKLFNYY
jgi:hypothetical protein